jgi:DNA-binding transcriptional MerR regulator
MEKSADAFRTISEAATDLGVPQHVLRFWETRFTQIKPMKRGGGRRYYRPEDIELLKAIRHLLYGEGYTIRGVQRLLKEQGQKAVIQLAVDGPPAPVAASPNRGPAPSLASIESVMIERESLPEASSPHVVAHTSAELAARHMRTIEAVLSELAECSRILAVAETTE